MSWRVKLLVLLLLTRGNVQGRQRRQLHVRRADLAVGLQRESALCLIWQPRRPAAARVELREFCAAVEPLDWWCCTPKTSTQKKLAQAAKGCSRLDVVWVCQ